MLQLNNVKSGYSTGVINSNFQAIEDYLNNYVLNRDGVVPGQANQMEVDLDMNSQDILNVGRMNANRINLGGIPIKELLDNTVGESTQEANRAKQEADRAKQEADSIAGALDEKVDKVAGKVLSTHDFTSAEKSKLAGIEAGAQVNAVTSVAGKTGAVTLVKGDVGLGNVDNTSDEDKPVSTAQQAALDGKVDKVAGMGLSSNDFTDPLRDKLMGIESGATANSTDAYLLDRANHTGTQAISTVAGLQDALDAIDGLIGDIGSALDAINGEVI